MTIEENFRRVLEQVRSAEHRAGRPEGSVTIVGVSKTVERDAVDRAYAAGVRHFGENRVQDAKDKFDPPLPSDAHMHLIGYLQTNKARDAVTLFDTIHSVDRLSVVDALEKRAKQAEKRLRVLIQVNVAEEEQKHGCSASDAEELVMAAHSSEQLDVCGLMTIAPLVATSEEARPVFRELRELRDRIQLAHPELNLSELSMGMTNDFSVAIEEGSTLVRIGRAIFVE